MACCDGRTQVEAELKRLTEEDLPMAAMAALAWDNDLKHNAGEEEDEHQLASRMVSVRSVRLGFSRSL